MGTIFRRGKRWGINYVDPHGRQIRKMVSPDKETAQRILKKVETQVAEGRYLDIKENKNVSFWEFAEEYIKIHVRLELRSAQKQENLIRHFMPYFKDKNLQQIDKLMIMRFMTERSQTVRPASVNRDLSALKSMFNRAIEWEKFDGANPVRGVKKIPENNSRCRWLTENEQARLLSCCHGLLKVMVLIALKTGMRWGEIITLKWSQAPCSNYVDFDNNVIYVHESLAKSRHSRYIPMSNAVREALQNMPRLPNTDYIFLNPKTSKPYGSAKQSFKTALKKAGISDFRFHDLRHTFASQLVRNGVDLYVVQKLLGHATPKMTQRYAHLKSDQLFDAIQKIDLQAGNDVYNKHFGFNDSTFLAHPRFFEKDKIAKSLHPIVNKLVARSRAISSSGRATDS